MKNLEGDTQTAPEMHDEVVRASLGSYVAVGQLARAFWEMPEVENGSAQPDLLLPGLRRVEEIETEDSFDRLDENRISQIQRMGMELWFVVPLSRVSEAHQRLRGMADRVQPWWVIEDRIVFGYPRVP